MNYILLIVWVIRTDQDQNVMHRMGEVRAAPGQISVISAPFYGFKICSGSPKEKAFDSAEGVRGEAAI